MNEQSLYFRPQYTGILGVCGCECFFALNCGPFYLLPMDITAYTMSTPC